MQKRTHLISFVNTSGHTCYIKSVGRTGSVTVTNDRAKARRFPDVKAYELAHGLPLLTCNAVTVEAAA